MDEDYRSYIVEKSKRYMQHIRSLNHSVRMLEAEMDELRDMAAGLHGIDYSKPYVKSSPSTDAIPNALARIESIMAEYEAELGEFLDEQHTAHVALRNVDAVYAELLSFRYVQGMPWADVAARMHHAEDYVRKELHDDALAALYPYIPHGWRDPIHRAI